MVFKYNKKSISNCFTTTTLSDEDANNIVSEYSDKKKILLRD
jgi:hypothetical protein